MYRRPKFVEILLDIRREMAESADFDVDLFAEMVRSGHHEVKAAEQKLMLATRPAKSERDKGPELRRPRG